MLSGCVALVVVLVLVVLVLVVVKTTMSTLPTPKLLISATSARPDVALASVVILPATSADAKFVSMDSMLMPSSPPCGPEAVMVTVTGTPSFVFPCVMAAKELAPTKTTSTSCMGTPARAATLICIVDSRLAFSVGFVFRSSRVSPASEKLTIHFSGSSVVVAVVVVFVAHKTAVVVVVVVSTLQRILRLRPQWSAPSSMRVAQTWPPSTDTLKESSWWDGSSRRSFAFAAFSAHRR
mmetsp:Transcript_88982/g.252204  ORF Transcript_88982/g.252204 Transcript_88982/m.252204 type:complete len:237 (-) Transcript_88982:552-1262(-)